MSKRSTPTFHDPACQQLLDQIHEESYSILVLHTDSDNHYLAFAFLPTQGLWEQVEHDALYLGVRKSVAEDVRNLIHQNGHQAPYSGFFSAHGTLRECLFALFNEIVQYKADEMKWEKRGK